MLDNAPYAQQTSSGSRPALVRTVSAWSYQGGKLPSNARVPVSQSAVRRIQAMIVGGAFAPGERLPAERKLAQQLAVSRASLREALSTLETLGLVRVEPHRGTFVSGAETAEAQTRLTRLPVPIWRFANRYTLREVYQFRAVIESYAARLAAMAVSDTAAAALRQIVEQHREATRQLDLVGSSQADFELHHRVMQLANNRIFADLHSNYRAVLLESQRVPVARRERVWETVDEHQKLVEAIARCDPDGAEYYMRLHITRAADRVGIALGDTPCRAGAAGDAPFAAASLAAARGKAGAA